MTTTAIYNDFNGLAALRREARSTPDEAIEEVAAQFESLFVQMMLKSMRDASPEGGLFNSSQLDTYQQMFDQQLALDISKEGGLGLARVLVQQLQAVSAEQPGTPDSERMTPPARAANPAAATPRQPEALVSNPLEALRSNPLEALRSNPLEALVSDPLKALVSDPLEARSSSQLEARPPLQAATAETWQPQTPEKFIEGLWQHARDAAAELGVAPEVLVAQAALETGWGKRMVQGVDGNSLNLFNIKAHGDWQGPAAVVNTLEYEEDGAAMRRDAFRVYESIAASFEDYVGLIKGSARYQPALAVAADNGAYLQELQRAGYATDPLYADKIMGIVGDERFAAAISSLKNSAKLPLNG